MKRYAKINLIFFYLLFLVITLTFPPSSYANGAETELVIIVPDDYVTIQGAIDIASDGDVIFVKPGTYSERLRIYKSVTVLGSGASSTVIESPGGGHTVEISKGANNVVFAGFMVKGADTSWWSGIYVRSLYNTIRENLIVGHKHGITMYDSTGNVLRSNNLSNNRYNLKVWGIYISHFRHDIDPSNFVDGKPIYYWVNQQNRTVPPDAGYVAIVDSSNIIVKNLDLSNNLAGVLLAHTNNSTVTNVTTSRNERGLYLVYSHNNTVVNNNFSGDEWSGISLISSSGNHIVGNTLSYNEWFGIRLSHAFPLLPSYSANNVISGNTIKGNKHGIYLESSEGNRVSVNEIMNNTYTGLTLDDSSGNIIHKNTLVNNELGAKIYGSHNNILYNNNFINNTVQVDVSPYPLSKNIWDNDYPSGGNYWSDYAGVDAKSGVNQSQQGSDGIGDSPYIIDSDNQDLYPLMDYYVLLLGDFDDNGKIDIRDIVIVAKSFGSYPGHLKWNLQADLNSDNKIDIRDLVMVAKNFGRINP